MSTVRPDTLISISPPSLIPPALAAALTGLSAESIETLIARGLVRTDRIKARIYVCLEDCEREGVAHAAR